MFELSARERQIFRGLPLELLEGSAWPSVQQLDTLLFPLTGFHFEVQKPSRYRRKLVCAEDDYNGRICCERQVPTRERNLHDLMNALVWAAFPRSKSALHRCQYEALQRQLADGCTLRSPERDRLSMFDEGGVILQEEGRPLVFGHAILEQVIQRRPWPRVSILQLRASGDPDATLAAFLEKSIPRKLPTVELQSVFPTAEPLPGQDHLVSFREAG